MLYTANDGQLDSNPQIVRINIEPINDTPIISSIENQEILEDESLELILSALDVDGDTLSYSSYTENENVILDVVGNELALKSRLFGQADIFAVVNDDFYQTPHHFH